MRGCLRCRTRHHIGSIAPRTLVVQYDFKQLARMRDAVIDDLFEIAGVQEVGITIPSNKIRIGISSAKPGARSEAEALLHNRAVPENAISISVDEPISFTCSTPTGLTGCFRPAPAGVYTETWDNGGAGLRTFCTLGAATDRYTSASGWLPGWVTAAHCVPHQYINNSRWVYQSTNSYPRVGVEAVNPQYWLCGTRLCSYADAAWIRSDGPGGHMCSTAPLRVPRGGISAVCLLTRRTRDFS